MMNAALLSVLLGWAHAGPAKPAEYGILLLAHGGTARWNKEVLAIKKSLDAKVPTEVALGMADAGEIQKAADRLAGRRAAKIVAVPLFINSASEVMDQTRYVLGLSDKPSAVLREAMARMPMGGHHHHMSFDERATISLPLSMTPALDDSPLVGQILLERAKALSRAPARETVVLVGHGPVDDRANLAWLETMRTLAGMVQQKEGFKEVEVATIRDDSPPEVKAKAAAALREQVRQAGEGGGRALVVPYLIAPGGIEDHIVEILKGLSYAWDGKTICPHPAISRWAADTAAAGAKADDMRLRK